MVRMISHCLLSPSRPASLAVVPAAPDRVPVHLALALACRATEPRGGGSHTHEPMGVLLEEWHTWLRPELRVASRGEKRLCRRLYPVDPTLSLWRAHPRRDRPFLSPSPLSLFKRTESHRPNNTKWNYFLNCMCMCVPPWYPKIMLTVSVTVKRCLALD